MVAGASNKQALRKCCNVLENVISGGTWPQGSSGHGSGREMKSPGSCGMVGSYSPARGSARKKSRLYLSGKYVTMSCPVASPLFMCFAVQAILI